MFVIAFWSTYVAILALATLAGNNPDALAFHVEHAIGIGGIIGGSIVSGLLSRDAGDSQADAARGSVGEQRRQFDLIREDTAPYREVGQDALFSMSRMMGLPTADRQQFEQQNRLAELRDQMSGVKKFITTGGRMENRGRRGHVFVPESTTLNPEFERLQQEIADLEGSVQAGGGTTFDENGNIIEDDSLAAVGGDYGGFRTSPGYQWRFDEGNRALDRSLAASGGRLSGRAVKEAIRWGQGLASDEFDNQFNRMASLAGTGQTAVGQSGTAGMQAAGNIGNSLMAAGRAEAGGALGVNQAIQGGIGNLISYQNFQDLMSRLPTGGSGTPYGFVNPVMAGG